MENIVNSQKSLTDRIWDFFASIKLAAVIFGLIALSSILGTILEQQAEPEKNLKLLAKIFGEGAAPVAYRTFDFLGFFNMYHSWWFVLFLILFATNLIICSLDRLPNILKIVRQPLSPIPIDKFTVYPIKRELSLKTSSEKIKDQLREALRKAGFKLRESDSEGGLQFFSQKGVYTRLGVYITHLSIIVILLGAVIGIFFGFNGFLNLPEGYTSDVAYSRKTMVPHPLGFSVRCDDFDVEFYRDMDMPKDYKSWLTVIKDGKEVIKHQPIEVNTPLRFEGYTLYQSSYGVVPNPKGMFILDVTSQTGKKEEVTAEPGGSFEIPGTGVTGKITDFKGSLAFKEDGSTYSYSDMMVNPAVFIRFYKKGNELYSGWILKRYPQTWNLPDGNKVAFVDYWGAQYTGLQVRKDPGVWIVYLGCILMAIGLYSAFFMSHRKIWVSLVPESKGGSRILLAATANKNRPAFESKIEQITNQIKNL